LIPGHIDWLTVPRSKRIEGQVAPSDELETGLARCDLPFMFVEGENDPLLQSGWAKSMAELMPNGTSKVMPGSHMIHLDFPSETAALIREWTSETLD